MGEARRRKLAGSGFQSPKERIVRVVPPPVVRGIVKHVGHGHIGSFALLAALAGLQEPQIRIPRGSGKRLI